MPNLDRLELVLRAIVELYIRTAKPVSSKVLIEEYGLDYSPATIRNDMAYLEAEGYIAQPHTSAGRVPTEKGYHDYISNFVPQHKKLTKSQRTAVERVSAVPSKRDEDRSVREMARQLSDITDEAVLVSLNGRDFYTAGISNVFRKPEFSQRAELMLEMASMIDSLDDVMHTLRESIEDDVQVFIGDENPVANETSIVVSSYRLPAGRGVVGILGPMRMDYGTNIAILEYMEELLNNNNDR